jgi:hypothetical protein
MSLPFAFWDSSAIIPICVPQIQTKQARALYKCYGMVVWWITPAEMISGFTRLLRMGQIGSDQFHAAKQSANELAMTWDSVHPSSRILSHACALLEVHPLRAADALQLAAALENFEHKPAGRVFVTADIRQAEAARVCGFSVELI